MTKTIVKFEGNLQCRAIHAESGVELITDAPKDNQGNGASFSPSDLLSVSLGSCILSSMSIAARLMKVDMSGATAMIEKEMANAPRRIAALCVRIHVPHQFDGAQRTKLEAAAHACPVHNMLNVEAPIIFSWG